MPRNSKAQSGNRRLSSRRNSSHLNHHRHNLSLSNRRLAMKRKLAVAIGLISMSIPALAQFGSGIVYDPTQSAHAIQQIQQFEQQLQKAEQQIQKAEQIYTTALQTRNTVVSAYNLSRQ